MNGSSTPPRSHAFLGLLPVLVLLGIWELAARTGGLPGGVFLPSLVDVLKESVHLLESGLLVESFLLSFLRVAAGFAAGSFCGLVMGILMGWNAVIGKAFRPIISILYPIPALGWLPLLMLWVGVNALLPVVVIFICSFFPVCYNTASGIRNVEPQYIRAARTLGASEPAILLRVILPLALPAIFTGLRLESGMAWRVVIAAEMVAIPTGIGALMMRAESLVRMDIIILCLMVLSVMCLSFEKLFIYLENRFTSPWK